MTNLASTQDTSQTCVSVWRSFRHIGQKANRFLCPEPSLLPRTMLMKSLHRAKTEGKALPAPSSNIPRATVWRVWTNASPKGVSLGHLYGIYVGRHTMAYLLQANKQVKCCFQMMWIFTPFWGPDVFFNTIFFNEGLKRLVCASHHEDCLVASPATINSLGPNKLVPKQGVENRNHSGTHFVGCGHLWQSNKTYSVAITFRGSIVVG